MKKYSYLAAILTGSFFCLSAAHVDHQSSGEAVECSSEFFTSYFPAPFVDAVLKKHDFSKEQIAKIQHELARHDKDVIKRVEEKASKMNPNPLEDPQNRKEAVKLFRETIIDIFTNALQEHGVKDDKKALAMLDEIQQMKSQRFSQCIKEGKLTPPDHEQQKNKPDHEQQKNKQG